MDMPQLGMEEMEQINALQDQYAYWSDVKYKRIKGLEQPERLWAYMKSLRRAKSIDMYVPYRLHFSMSNHMMRACHLFDMNFGGSWGSESILPQKNRNRYLVNSIIEEAISSSQMEGASTTRRVAREMLRKKMLPKDKSQQMIFNNYNTITYLSEHTGDTLSVDMILRIHALITDRTLTNPEDSGRFRDNDDVVVENSITGEVVHVPPVHEEIKEAMEWLVDFANNDSTAVFVHPVIKAIIIHFFISYLHPFVDGNGRTARALFHWYMLKQGYWLIQYMSISRVIYASKASYEKSFLQVEADGNDMGYFITYNINALDKAFEKMRQYIAKNVAQQSDENRLLRIGNINQRQAEILYMFLKDESLVLTVRDVCARLMVTPTTAKSDIVGLMNMGLLSEIPLNLQKKGYLKGDAFDEKVKDLI